MFIAYALVASHYPDKKENVIGTLQIFTGNFVDLKFRHWYDGRPTTWISSIRNRWISATLLRDRRWIIPDDHIYILYFTE
jgi:hypothetical protein